LEKQYNELLQQNSEEEVGLRKKSYKVESEVENWIHKYDQEVGERHNELEALIVNLKSFFFFFFSYFKMIVTLIYIINRIIIKLNILK